MGSARLFAALKALCIPPHPEPQVILKCTRGVRLISPSWIVDCQVQTLNAQITPYHPPPKIRLILAAAGTISPSWKSMARTAIACSYAYLAGQLVDEQLTGHPIHGALVEGPVSYIRVLSIYTIPVSGATGLCGDSRR